MKKILQVVSGMNAGGMESLIMNYYKCLDKTKYQFDFMIMQQEKCFFEDEIIKMGGHIYRFPYATPHRIKNHIEVKKFLKSNKYDVIHCHQGITYYAPLKYAKKYGIKTRIVHSHGINIKFLKYLKLYNNLWARRRISNLATDLISCSKLVVDHIFDNKHIKNKEYIVLPNSIFAKNYIFDEKARINIRKEFNIKENIKLYIHIGTFTYPKNHEFLLSVFNKLNDINSKLLLVGSGPLEKEIIEYINANNLNERVILTGNRNDIPSLLSASDIMLFPSRWEGLPLTLIEAQSNGIPIIASKNISNEVVATDNIKLLDIVDEKVWINEINNMKLLSSKDRMKYNKEMCDSVFNVENSIKVLQKIYDK